MTKSIKYMGESGKYTKNGTPNGFTSITPWSIMTRIEDLSEEESSRRVAEWAKSISLISKEIRDFFCRIVQHQGKRLPNM